MLSTIMSNATCPNCGATSVIGAKFCRQCGRLVPSASAQSVTEATTRTLRAPVEFGAQPTNVFSSQPTGPAYMSPAETPQPPAYQTNSLEQRGRKSNALVLSMMAILFIIALIASLFALGIIKVNSGGTITQPPPATAPQPPTETLPELPPPPPAPPTDGTSSFNRTLIYPGAETVMDMRRGGGGHMLQLRTKDSYDKVVDWYVARLKPEEILRSPGQNTVLKSGEAIVVINSAGDATMVILKGLGEMETEMEEHE